MQAPAASTLDEFFGRVVRFTSDRFESECGCFAKEEETASLFLVRSRIDAKIKKFKLVRLYLVLMESRAAVTGKMRVLIFVSARHSVANLDLKAVRGASKSKSVGALCLSQNFHLPTRNVMRLVLGHLIAWA